MRASGEKPFGKRDKSAAESNKGGSNGLAGLGALAASAIAYLIHRALFPKPRTTATTAGSDGGFDASSDSGDGGGD